MRAQRFSIIVALTAMLGGGCQQAETNSTQPSIVISGSQAAALVAASTSFMRDEHIPSRFKDFKYCSVQISDTSEVYYESI